MQVMSTHQLTVIPVIDEQSEFIGAISAYHLMEVISLIPDLIKRVRL